MKRVVITNLVWKFLERGGTQGIQFIIQIILARLLLPEDFGTIAIVTVFISFARIFVQNSFNTALIQKKNVDELDFSSIFYLSLLVASILYIFIYISAPSISNFYNKPILVNILRVLAITLFFGAVNSIQNAYIAKNMMFKRLFFSSLGAIITSGTFGITLAYLDFGVWALVIQQLVQQLTITFILWFTVKWRPILKFSLKRVDNLFSFGWKMLLSSIINVIYLNIRTLIIGRVYSPAILGYYNRGEQFPKVIVSNIDGSIQSVMLPTLSSHQDNTDRVKEMVRRAIVSSSFIIFPMMIGMAVVAKPLVIIVLTDKWLASTIFLQIFCISYAMMPIHTANIQAINALGRSDVFLKIEVIKKTIGILILIFSIPFGVYAIAIGMLISDFLSTFINAYPNKHFLDYSYKEQIMDVLPSLIVSLIMGAIIFALNYLNISTSKLLVLQIIIGILSYILLSKLFKIESYNYLIKTIRQMRNIRRNSI